MAKETYSIPNAPNDRYDFERNVISLSKTNAAVWGIPDTVITNLTTLQAAYEIEYNVANNKNTQSPAVTAARDAAWEPLKESLSDLYNHYLINNNSISVSDKDALFIHYSGTGGGKSAPAPTTTPLITLLSEEISVLHVVYSDSTTPGKHYKPDNVAFCELAYLVGTAPSSVSDCTERINVSRSHKAIVFSESQRGKIIYAFARWVNRNGKFGPWSGISTALIP